MRDEGDPISTQPRGTGGAYNGTGETEGKTPIQYASLCMIPVQWRYGSGSGLPDRLMLIAN